MKKIIVTGSEGLIGRPLCSLFEKKGVDVVRLDLSLGHDLCDEKIVKEIFREHKGNCLINLIGWNHHIDNNETSDSSGYLNCSLESFQKFNKINVDSLFLVCREFIKNNKKDLNIVNFASLYGCRSPKSFIYPSSPKHIGYVTSKHAVIGFTRYLACHFPDEIKVNSIIPGGVDDGNIHEDFKDKYCEHVPMGRMAKVEDLLEILLFLCFKNTYITGTEIKVDGGYNAW